MANSNNGVSLCLTGGYLAHSLAIMTDAAHLLTDFGSMMVSLFSLWISSRPPTKTMNFGWHRSGQDERSDTFEWMDGVRRGEDEWMERFSTFICCYICLRILG